MDFLQVLSIRPSGHLEYAHLMMWIIFHSLKRGAGMITSMETAKQDFSNPALTSALQGRNKFCYKQNFYLRCFKRTGFFCAVSISYFVAVIVDRKIVFVVFIFFFLPFFYADECAGLGKLFTLCNRCSGTCAISNSKCDRGKRMYLCKKILTGICAKVSEK